MMDEANIKITDIDLTQLIAQDEEVHTPSSQRIVYGLSSPAGAAIACLPISRNGSGMSNPAFSSGDIATNNIMMQSINRTKSAGRFLGEHYPDSFHASLLHSTSAPSGLKAVHVADDDVMSYFSTIEARNDSNAQAFEASIRGELSVRSSEGIAPRVPMQEDGTAFQARFSGPLAPVERSALPDERPPRSDERATVHGANNMVVSGGVRLALQAADPVADFVVFAEEEDDEGWQPIRKDARRSFFKRLSSASHLMAGK